jgi:DNA-directed RNA polymerase subunit M/transcription elongation factor TFIIS
MMKKCPKCGSKLDWRNDIKFIDGHYYCNNCPESKKNKLENRVNGDKK